MESARTLANGLAIERDWTIGSHSWHAAKEAIEWLLEKQHTLLLSCEGNWNPGKDFASYFQPGEMYGPDPEPTPIVATEADSTVVRKGNNIVHLERWVADAIRADERKRLGQ